MDCEPGMRGACTAVELGFSRGRGTDQRDYRAAVPRNYWKPVSNARSVSSSPFLHTQKGLHPG